MILSNGSLSAIENKYKKLKGIGVVFTKVSILFTTVQTLYNVSI